MATPVDFTKYLQSLLDSYETKYHRFYTLTDLQVEVRVEISPEDRSPETAKNKPDTKIDTLKALAEIRKYLRDGNVLLAGKPGSGKSTVLLRFRWELALEALKDGDRPIPVLVQLRSDRSIVQAICAEFRQAKLRVSDKEVDDLLLDRKLLLLLDGVNEMPSPQRRQDLQQFRDDNPDTPMIFTTRDLALGGSLGIEKKLEMCALTQPQMREFVHKHLPQHGDLLLRQLRDRLREIAETPLLLWMMCEVFESTGKIPQSKGELFEQFHYKYKNFKGNIPVSEDSRRFTSELLPQLAFVMLQGDLQQPTEGLVAISRNRAEGILEGWLHHRGVLDAPTKAKEWLEDLLEHHLLQVAAKPEEIEFHHQLFQEYYAGRALRKLLVEKHQDAIDDERLQHFYLNYFKWTEPLAFMLSLLGDEVQAVRVVRLALEVDVMLGARLAGEVQREFQQRAFGLVDGLDVPGWLKVELLGEVRSDEAIPGLLKLLEDSDKYMRGRAANALGKIGSEVAIPGLLKLFKDSDPDMRFSAANALGEIGSEAAISGLLKLVEDLNPDVRFSAANALGKIGYNAAISGLLKLIEDPESYVRSSAANALGQIGSEAAIMGLLKLVENSNSDVRTSATYALCKIGAKATIPGLLELIKHSNSNVRWKVAVALSTIGAEAAIPGLIKLIKDSDSYVRWTVADSLAKIGSDVAIPGLLQLVKDSDSTVRKMVADGLGRIGSEAAIPGLLQLVEDSNSYVRLRAADGLGKIHPDAAVPGLLQLVKDSDSNVRRMAGEVLVKISPDVAITGLLQLVEDSDWNVRKMATDTLGKIGSDEAIPGLLKLIEHSDSNVRWNATDALGTIGTVAISELLQLLKDSDWYLRGSVAETLGKIASEEAILGLLKLVEDSDSHVRKMVANALGNISSEATIPGLLKLVEDSYSHVRRSATDALGNIAKQHTEAVAPHLPHLLTLIPSKSGKEVHRLILAIQAACKYYNYSIRQLPLLPESRSHPANPSASVYIQSIEEFKLMSNQPPIFNQQNATIGVNYAAENSNPKIIQKIEAAQQSSPEAALNAVVQIIQALEKKYTYVKDEQQARDIIDAEFKEIKEQKPIEWQNLISLKRLYNGGKNAAVKVCEHFAESSVWGKAGVGFLEGVSEDVN